MILLVMWKTPVPPAEFPALAAELHRAKSLAEGRARASRELVWELNQDGIEREGRRLYDDAKVDYDECIAYLKSALIRGFNGEDQRVLRGKLEKAEDRASRFLRWCDSLLDRTMFGTDIGDMASLLLDLTKWWASTNEAAIQKLADEVELCRWKSWEELIGEGSDPTRSRDEGLKPAPGSILKLSRPGAEPGPYPVDDNPALPDK
ncbi:hypothetical protein [Paludisphaera mucosa]|uniref:Uncharacterized protein n=1 Tax=Paludisphaera mucosa TaxID=3030827 RepID=A0ABT6F6U4_9BACT|nr:hypothetical protein [Paludisphaera mucosa]MDG3003279.1 hypothetical protein [Paludisphaera mucosa]